MLFVCEELKALMSTPPAEVALKSSDVSGSSPGFLVTRFTNPAIAPPPYKVELEPLIIST